MGVNLKQSGFSGGQISTTVLGRSDQQKYATGLRTCTNAWVTRYGTIENRPGLIFDNEVKDSSNTVREVPFIFSTLVSYLLEFGANYIRPYRNGARISVAGALGWSVFASYAVGDLVTYSGVVYRALLISTGDQPDINPTIWNTQADDLLEIVTTIPQGALATLQYVQQSDIMTLVDHLFHPAQLLRYSDTRWVFATFLTSAGIDTPTGVSVVAGFPSTTIATPTGLTAVGGIAGVDTGYMVTAYANSPSRESPPTSLFTLVLAEPDPAFPVTVSWNVVAGAVGYAVYRSDTIAEPSIVGVTDALSFVDSRETVNLNGAIAIKGRPGGPANNTLFTYVVTAVSDSTGAESLQSTPASATGGTPTTANPNVIMWGAVAGAASYRIYKNVNGVFGFIGTSSTLSFFDDNIIADTSIQPPSEIPLFQSSDDWPAVVGYYQQRLLFANTVNQPQTVWASRVGSGYNFTQSTPVQDDDAFDFTIAGRQVQQVRALVDLGKLVIHTSNAEYVANGNQAGTLTPSEPGLVANGSSGSSHLTPVIIGNSDLFIQDGSTRLLDIRWNVQSFSYDGKDLTKYAADLFVGRTVVDMAWQKLPHSIVWCVLDNGQLIGMTYVREDELWAWHVHESTNGDFENVCVVPEGSNQTVYCVVRRTIEGVTRRYIEQMALRECLDQVLFSDSFFVDSGLVYDGRNGTSTTITVTTASGWTPTDLLTLTASASTFTVGDVGNQFVFRQVDDSDQVTDLVTFVITGYTSPTVVTGNAQRTVPTWAQMTPILTWGRAVSSFSGIDHLEGEDLAILTDGSVAANPLDPQYPVVTVTGGAFTLTSPAVVVVAGLPMQTDVQTLPVENASGETIANRQITVRRSTPVFHQSRGGMYGQDFDHLNQWKQPRTSPMGYPVNAITGAYSVPLNGAPQRSGQWCARNTDPCPWGLSALVLTGEVSDAT